jgi:hypothetical protein
MTNRHFTDRQLYALRNDIPVDTLMEKLLGVPSKLVGGYFRFLCPLCGAFNTAVNPETNLARCFDCRKNFNAIDLVMIIRKLDFVNSVRFLQNHYESASLRPKNAMKCADQPETHNNRPTPISHILDCLMSPKQQIISPCRRPSTDERISSLEQKVDRLSNQLSDILKAIHIHSSSRQ